MALRLLESSLYCDDLPRAARFYEGVLALRALVTSDRLVALDAGQHTVLLLFQRGASAKSTPPLSPTQLPPHDGQGPLHLAFAITADELPQWEARLDAAHVAIEHRVSWERGGTSIYFRDTEGHLVELATPGVWETY